MKKPVGPLLVIFSALVALTPQLVRGNSCGHDFNVHLVSWLDCANAWRHGIPYPHWTASPNFDAGEPRFVFYPPLTWVAGAALGLLLNWTIAPIALTFLTLAGTGLATRALALEACEDAVATLAGCTAIFCGFSLFTAYERTAFPEFMGGVWLPLLLLYALRDRTPEAGPIRRALDGSVLPLAVILGLSWLSNAPLGVMASYLLAAVALLAAMLRRSWAPVIRAAIATALGLAATAFYWIPAKMEQRWVDIRQATNSGYDLENNWAFAHHSDPALALHDFVLHQVSWIAISMIAIALASAAICWRRGTLLAQKNTRWPISIPLVLIPVAILILLFPISRPVWHLPEWRFLQYPWRWLEALEAPMSIFFAAAVWPSLKNAKRLVAAASAALFIASTWYAGTAFFQTCWAEDTVAETLKNFASGPGFIGMYEYAPPGSDLSLIAMGLPDACLVRNPRVVLGKPSDDSDNPIWKTADGTCEATYSWTGGRAANPEHRHMQLNAPQDSWLVLRLLSYPAWKIQINAARAGSLTRTDGLIAVPVKSGPSILTVDWTTPSDVTASRWISAFGLLALLTVGFLERRRNYLR